MDKVLTNYTFSKTAKTVTFSDYTTIRLDHIKAVINVTSGTVIYQPNSATKNGTVLNNVLTLTYDTSSMNDADKLMIIYDDGSSVVKGVGQINDWTAVAQNVQTDSAVLDCSLMAALTLHLQMFLDSETAHLGTQFEVWTSAATSGDEDWNLLTAFVSLIGTANSEAITNNPLAAGATTITCASTTGYTANGLRAIKNGTIANSEIVMQTGLTTNTNITIKNGVTNQHAQNTVMYNIADTNTIVIPATVNRVKVTCNNQYSPSGSTCVFKVRYTYNSVA